MMNYQRLSISMIFIVLSLVHAHAAKSQRQGTSQCPNVNLCDFSPCANGQCVDNKTSSACFTCTCNAGFTGAACETSIPTSTGCNPACLNGGQCQVTATSTYACVCLTDYTGSQCETSTLAAHPCLTMPGTVCANGGTCTVKNGADYLCNCAIGWTGTNCQTQDTITTCNSNPCGAHGTCQQAILPNNALAIFCICEAQWTGQRCDANLTNNCPIGFCQSGGTCQMNGNIPVCSCPSTHTGQQCEIPTGLPSTTVIMPTATGTFPTITNPVTTFTSTGIYPTTSVSTVRPGSGGCSSSPCLNGGSCFNTGNDFICLCRPEYSGLTCSIQNSATTPLSTTTSDPLSSSCTPNPCGNGGSCFKYAGSFVCVCTAAYTGPTCTLAKTSTTPTVTTPGSAITCANQPCQNGATCYNTSNSYFCYCGASSSYSGQNCDIPKIPADPSCPLNCSPGYCVNAGGSQNAYACMCNGALTPTSCSSK